jgi:hypothetical protein
MRACISSTRRIAANEIGEFRVLLHLSETQLQSRALLGPDTGLAERGDGRSHHPHGKPERISARCAPKLRQPFNRIPNGVLQEEAAPERCRHIKHPVHQALLPAHWLRL